MRVTLRFQSSGTVPGNARPVTMRGASLTIGRGPDNDLVLPDPDRMVSKTHCVIENHGGNVVAVDLSTNGTFLNYGKVPLGRTPTPLNDGDVLSLGPYEIVVALAPGAEEGLAEPRGGLPPLDEWLPPSHGGLPPLDDGPAPFAGGVPRGSRGLSGGAGGLPPMGGGTAPFGAGRAAAGGLPEEFDAGGGDFLDDLLGGGGAPRGPSAWTGGADEFDGLLPPLGEEAEDPLAPAPLPDAGPAMPDHSPAARDAWRPGAPLPGPAPGAPVIPDDWDDDPLFAGGAAGPDFGPGGGDPFARPPVATPSVATPSVARPSVAPPLGSAQPGATPPDPAQPGAALPLDPLAGPLPLPPFAAPPFAAPPGGAEPPSQGPDPAGPVPPGPAVRPAPAATAAPRPTASPRGATGPALPPEAPPGPPAAQALAPAVGGEGAARAFLAALGAQDVPVSDAELGPTMVRLGATLRAMIAGLREILMTRTSIKSEFRIDQTMIGAGGNNPLKFSVSPEQAIEAIVRPDMRGYLGAEAAAAQALDDIKAHEVAMMTGMEAALKGVLARLDPAALSTRIEARGGLGGLLKGRKAQYWETYERMYAEVSDQAENDFHELFAKEFAQAYKDQLARLKAGARPDPDAKQGTGKR